VINNVPSFKQEYASAICKVQEQDFVMTVEERVSSGLRNYATMLCSMWKNKQLYDLEKNMGSISSLLADDLCR